MTPVAQTHGSTAVERGVPEVRRWSRQEYEQAGELGLFGPEERLELIGGEVVRKMTPQKAPHASGIVQVESVLRALAIPETHLRVQLPLSLSDDSEPEPDVAIVTGRPSDYAREHPTTALLVVEVADATLRFDRTVKAGLYASAGIPEYWILNLADRVLEILRQPAPMTDQPFGHHYRSVTRHAENELVRSLLSDRDVAVADLLPRV